MKTTAPLALLCAVLLGALARDLLASPARADAPAITRSDLDRVLRALESNAKASADVARAVQDAGRACK